MATTMASNNPNGGTAADVADPATVAASPTITPRESRAVLRLIEPGSMVDCSHCGSRVKFQARVRFMQVICNVYTDGKWHRVEHFHQACYDEAGQPFGAPLD
jgi:hypothetical protein